MEKKHFSKPDYLLTKLFKFQGQILAKAFDFNCLFQLKFKCSFLCCLIFIDAITAVHPHSIFQKGYQIIELFCSISLTISIFEPFFVIDLKTKHILLNEEQ